MDDGQGVLVRLLQQLLFEFFDAFAESFEHREALVDNQVDERMQQRVDTKSAQAAGVIAQALAHRFERVVGSGMKTHQVIRADEQADLRGDDMALI